MAVPYRFKNAKPPVSDFDLDAEKFNKNNDAITNGSAIDAGSIKNDHIDTNTVLPRYRIKKFITKNDILTKNPIIDLSLSLNDIVAINDTTPDCGKIYKVKEDYIDLYSIPDNEDISGWINESAKISVINTFAHILGQSNDERGGIEKSITVDLDQYPILKIQIESVSVKWAIVLKGGSIPGGELEIVNSGTIGNFEYNVKTLTGLSGEQTFTLVIQVYNPGDYNIGETVDFSNLKFDNPSGLWSLYKPIIINQIIINENDEKEYKLFYTSTMDIAWFLIPIMDDTQETYENTWSAKKIKEYVDSLLP